MVTLRPTTSSSPLAFLACLVLLVAAIPRGAGAADASQETAAVPSKPEATVSLNQRRIVELRGMLQGDGPAERAALASVRLREAAAAPGPGAVARVPVDGAIRFDVDGQTVFFLTAADVPGPATGPMLDAAAARVERRLSMALQEAREAADPRRQAIAAGLAAGMTVLAGLVAFVLWKLRQAAATRLKRRIDTLQIRHRRDGVLATFVPHFHTVASAAVVLAFWLAALSLLEAWATGVLELFAYTRPWGERAATWVVELLQGFALGIFRAVPGLLTALLILMLARVLVRALSLLLERVERGELSVSWLDIDTAAPTRRIGNFVIWMFALALAYPYLPGASSESFKGVTVLAGLMLSLGAASVVGQAMAGVSLMYSRSIRVGEYVRIGETEGTVAYIGMFATKIQTGMGEETILPNSVIVTLPVRNFSRLVDGGRCAIQCAVTIGYSTPWRQVHAMLLEAARRSEGVVAQPQPYVIQTALSDFYVEYRLCAQADSSVPLRRSETMSRLHANIQDVFSENGVQITSPHYVGDPREIQVMQPGEWFAPQGRPLGGAARDVT